MNEPITEAGRELVEEEPLLVHGEHDMLTRVRAIEASAYMRGFHEAINVRLEAENGEALKRALAFGLHCVIVHDCDPHGENHCEPAQHLDNAEAVLGFTLSEYVSLIGPES